MVKIDMAEMRCADVKADVRNHTDYALAIHVRKSGLSLQMVVQDHKVVIFNWHNPTIKS